jgi:predicted nucleotidyltransferase
MDKIIPLRVNATLVGELDELVENGVFPNRNEGLRASLRGALQHYRRKSSDIHRTIAQFIANALMNAYPQMIKRIILFGSVAAGTHGPESDIDILVLTTHKLSRDEEKSIYWLVTILTAKIPVLPSIHLQEWQNFQEGVIKEYEFETKINTSGIILQEHSVPTVDHRRPKKKAQI